MVDKEMSNEEILNKLALHFDGRDPIKELNDRVKTMDKRTLEKLVLMSANTIGTALKGGDYESNYEAVLHVNFGADMLLNAYDLACIAVESNVNSEGTA